MRILIFLVLLNVTGFGHAESLQIGTGRIEMMPGAEIFKVVQGDRDHRQLVVLGSLEKVNHVVEPEASEYVRARKSAFTYYLPEARRTKNVLTYFLEQAAPLGELAFSCSGRGCGSSSYWANKIFDRAVLYGPEQNQHYVAVRLADNSGYLVIYVAERATQKIYVHIEYIDTSNAVVNNTGQ